MAQFGADWKTPSKTYRPIVRWWWPGLEVTEDELTKEVAELDAQGFGGAEIQAFLIGSGAVNVKPELAHRFAPHPYYYKMLETVLKEAKSRNLTIDLTIGSSWPPGSSTVSKSDSLQTLLMGTTIIQGPQHAIMQVPQFQVNTYYKFNFVRRLGPTLGFWAEDFKLVTTIACRPIKVSKKLKFVRPKAVPLDVSTVIDVSKHVDDAGILTWDVPDGKWQIFTIYAGPTAMTPMSSAKSAPDATSLVVDIFNEEALYRYLDQYIPLGRDSLSSYLGTTLRALFTDSQEIACEWYWTKDFFAEFERRRGYDVRPFLPACFVPNRDNQFTYVFFMNMRPCFDFLEGVGERIRHDWEETLSDLFAERYCAGVSRWGKQHGIQHRIQTYGIRVDLLKAYGHADIPETEQLFAGGLLDFLKLAGSAGIIYNKPLVTCESLVWMGRDYMTTPLKWKVAADRLFVAGINQLIYHGYPYFHPGAPHPGYYPWSPPNFSSNLNRNNPFWQYFPLLNAYITRAQYLLRQGTTCCNVGIYYPHWNYDHKCLVDEDLAGGYLPGFDGKRPGGPITWFLRRTSNAIDKLTRAQQELGHQLMQQGYYYVHVNDEVLLDSTLRDAKLHAGSAALEVILFPNITRITVPLAQKVREMVVAGIKVVFYGTFPEGQPGYLNYEKNDALVHDTLKPLLGKGATFVPKDTDIGTFMYETLQIPPGLRFQKSQPTIQYMYKEIPAGKLYFIRHGGQESLDVDVGFPNSSNVPYYLDLWTGYAEEVPDRRVDGDVTRITLRFPPYGSKMVLFSAKTPCELQNRRTTALDSYSRTAVHIEIPNWHLLVKHREMDGKPRTIELELPRLCDWREMKQLRYCSGPGIYSAQITLGPQHLAPETHLTLRLGHVHDVAMVRVNGHECPPLIVPPYEVAISRFAQEGSNIIEVTVTGTLRNLLVGYGKQGGRPWRHHRRRKLMPVGLIGPVQVDVEKVEPFQSS